MQGWLPHKSTHFFYKLIYFLAFWFFKLLYRHKIYGAEHFCPGAAILAANHVSFLDPPLLSTSAPQEVHFLARKTLFKGVLKPLISALNSHPVSGNAQDVAVFKMILHLLKTDKKVIIFPEGKRSSDGSLQPIKPGIAMLISRTKGAVIPAYLHGTYEIWPRGRKWPRLAGRTACVFGSPIRMSEELLQDKKQAQEEVARRIEDAICALKKWYEDGAVGTPP